MLGFGAGSPGRFPHVPSENGTERHGFDKKHIPNVVSSVEGHRTIQLNQAVLVHNGTTGTAVTTKSQGYMRTLDVHKHGR